MTMEAYAISIVDAEVAQPTPPVVTGHRNRRILVAEDDVAMRRLIAAALRAAGYPVVEASDGSEVLDRIESTIWADRHDLFGLIVSDMAMPALTGLDVLAALRCTEVRTPFILITAFGDDDVRAEAMALGATAVLDKPLDLEALQAAVDSALRADDGDATARDRSRRRGPKATPYRH
jgi:CheY-like chemotaxis protein